MAFYMLAMLGMCSWHRAWALVAASCCLRTRYVCSLGWLLWAKPVVTAFCCGCTRCVRNTCVVTLVLLLE